MKNLGWFCGVKRYSSEPGDPCGTCLSLDCSYITTHSRDSWRVVFCRGLNMASEERGDPWWGHQEITKATGTGREGKMPLSGNHSHCKSPAGFSLSRQGRALTWGFSALLTPLCRISSQGCDPSTRGNRPVHTKLMHYLVIDCHFWVGITFVESLHLTKQMPVRQIHHLELNRAGMGQGSELQLSEGSTKSKVSNACSYLS